MGDYFIECGGHNYVHVPISFALARAAICAEGSEPMDRMQISGVRGSDSSHVVSRLRMQPSPYSGPRESNQSNNKFNPCLFLNFDNIIQKYTFLLTDNVLSSL